VRDRERKDSSSCSGRRWRKEGGERSKEQYTSDNGEKFP